MKYTKDDVIKALLTLVPCAFNSGFVCGLGDGTRYSAEEGMEAAEEAFERSMPKEYLDGLKRRLEEIENGCDTANRGDGA